MIKAWLVTLFACLTLAACTEDVTTMNDLPANSAVPTLFAKTKPVCFGRFVIDVPEEAHVVWGRAAFAGNIEILEGGAQTVLQLANKKRLELQAVKHDELPGTLLINEVVEPNHRITLFFWGDPIDIHGSQAWTYLKVEPHGFISTHAVSNIEIDGPDYTPEAVKQKTDYVSKNIRARAPDEIPTEPGVCLDHGFIADASGKYQEIFQIGFRFPSLPGVSFSMSSNKNAQRDPPLTERAKKLSQIVKGTEYEAGLNQLKVLHEGKRQVGRWQAEELLHAFDEKGKGRHQEFMIESQGVRYDKDRPLWDAQLQTGVEGNRTGGQASALSDKEAIVLWNTLLNSLRLRVE